MIKKIIPNRYIWIALLILTLLNLFLVLRKSNLWDLLIHRLHKDETFQLGNSVDLINELNDHDFYSMRFKKNIQGKEISDKIMIMLLLSQNDCTNCIRNFENRLLEKLNHFEGKPYIITFNTNYNYIYRVTKKYKIDFSDLLIDTNRFFQFFAEKYQTPLIIRIDKQMEAINVYSIR